MVRPQAGFAHSGHCSLSRPASVWMMVVVVVGHNGRLHALIDGVVFARCH